MPDLETVKVKIDTSCIKYNGEYYERDTVIDIFKKDEDELIGKELVVLVPVKVKKQDQDPDPDPDLDPPKEDDLTEISGIGEETALALKNANYKTFDDIVEASPEDLEKLHGITKKKARAFIKAANAMFAD